MRAAHRCRAGRTRGWSRPPAASVIDALPPDASTGHIPIHPHENEPPLAVGDPRGSPLGSSVAWERPCIWKTGFPPKLRDFWLFHAIRHGGYVAAVKDSLDLGELEVFLQESAFAFLETVPWRLMKWRAEVTARRIAKWTTEHRKHGWVQSWSFKQELIDGWRHRAQVRVYVRFTARRWLKVDPTKVSTRQLADYCGVSRSAAHRALRYVDPDCEIRPDGGVPWTDAEREQLKELLSAYPPDSRMSRAMLDEISAQMPGRSPAAVRMALRRMSGVLSSAPGRHWTKGDDEKSRAALEGIEGRAERTEVFKKLAAQFGRTELAVRKRIQCKPAPS